jgi:hypothetical protein
MLSVKSMALVTLLIGWATAPTATRAATVQTAADPALTLPGSVTGVWAFKTNDTPDNLVRFTLFLRQQGTSLVGFDTGGEPVLGSVTGQTLSFTVYGVSSEDDYGGQGTLGPNGRLLGGSFWDGYGFTGVFVAVKLTAAP